MQIYPTVSDYYSVMQSEPLIVGTVSEVSPTSIMVEVDIEAPHGTSLANGALQRFPTVNGFVALPSENGTILAIILWVGIVDGTWAESRRDKDSLGLPEARRRLEVLPLGTLRPQNHLDNTFILERGTLVFPTVGDPVRLPMQGELAAAVPFASEYQLSSTIHLGTAPMAANRDVRINANHLFSKHLAILGNTGSGKSCSLAHIIRQGADVPEKNQGTYRAIVFDLNGEYGQTFSDLDTNISVRRFTVDPGIYDGSSAVDANQLRVPYWLWNFSEWTAFANASGKSQAPVLRQALHMARTTLSGGVGQHIGILISGRRITREFQNNWVITKDIPSKLSSLLQVQYSLKELNSNAAKESSESLRQLWTKLDQILGRRKHASQDNQWVYGARGLDLTECRELLACFDQALAALGMPDINGDISSVDSPIPFDAEDLVDLIELIAANSGNEVAHWVAPMQERLAVAMSDRRLKASCGFLAEETLQGWIESLLGTGSNSQITILDLSLVPSQAQHIIAGVISRLVLEVLERYKRLGAQIPVIVAVEEAHALMKRQQGTDLDDAAEQMTRVCKQSFERISREGRKFGLSLVVSSQRPSELSETVLSQCNSYLIHRIVNAKDQELIRKLVPDDLGGLLAEIPSYPTGTALLLGSAAEVPVLTEIVELAPTHRPSASDPDFNEAWSKGVFFDSSKIVSSLIEEPSHPPEEDYDAPVMARSTLEEGSALDESSLRSYDPPPF